MRGLPDTAARQSLAVNTAASGGASTVTLPTPVADAQNVIDWVVCSYAATPSGGVLTITNCSDVNGSAVTWSVDVTAAGATTFMFGDRGLRGILGSAMVVSLTDGGQAKDLNVQYR